MDLKKFMEDVSLSILFTFIIVISVIGLSWIIKELIPQDIKKEVPQKYIILECKEKK